MVMASNTMRARYGPRKLCSGTMSTLKRAISGPTNAATTPPARTSDMALPRKSSEATSAAAKRYCWPKAVFTPIRNVPATNIQKPAKKKLPEATAAPPRPIREPRRNPARRPTRRMKSEAGTVANAVPITMAATGTVASVLSSPRN